MLLRAGLMTVLGVTLACTGGCRGSKPETRQPPVQAANPTTDPREPTSAGDIENSTSSASNRLRPKLPVITGLRTEVIDQEMPLEGGRVSWSTRWRLCWAMVPGATGYLVTAVTPEGAGPPREIDQPCYDLTVANGVASQLGERPGRSQQLSLMQTMLSISVAARMSDGTVGPASPDIAVGSEYP